MPTLEARVTRLEERMDEVERLRASRDRDLSDVSEKLRVQGELIQAVASTQSEHTAMLGGHTALLNRHTAMHGKHEAALARLSLDMHGLKDGMQRIIGMLDTLIGREGGR